MSARSVAGGSLRSGRFVRRRQRAQARWPASERRERKRTVLRASHIRRSRSCYWLRLNHTHMASPAAVSAVERGPSNTPRCGTFLPVRDSRQQ